MNPVSAIRELFAELLKLPAEELVLRLTLLTLILHGASETWLDVSLQVLCGMMLVSRNQFRAPALWIVLCAVMWGINATHWLWIDNHKFLMSYWVLACTLAVLGPRTSQILRWNGRMLVGLCFAFATLWKIVAGQYWNGEFFTYTLLTDGRMDFIAHTLAGLPRAVLNQARVLEDTIALMPSETIQASLPVSPRLHFVAMALSWWTLVIEAAIAVLFLASRPFARRWRDWVLLTFVATTYVFVPVLGFGYILTILGLAACESPKIRAVYLGVLVVLQLGRLPWEDFLGR